MHNRGRGSFGRRIEIQVVRLALQYITLVAARVTLAARHRVVSTIALALENACHTLRN
jgi:hypothetical protein